VILAGKVCPIHSGDTAFLSEKSGPMANMTLVANDRSLNFLSEGNLDTGPDGIRLCGRSKTIFYVP